MRSKFVAIIAVATAVVAVPAQANEARVEARGGLVWAFGDEEAVAGVAAGYDFDLGDTGFVGAEVSADKVLRDGFDVQFGFTGRAGVNLTAADRFYFNGGYTVGDVDAAHLGAGLQHDFNDSLYGKIEYRHLFESGYEPDVALVGLGMRF
jgi:outer membrane immunogenic protein